MSNLQVPSTHKACVAMIYDLNKKIRRLQEFKRMTKWLPSWKSVWYKSKVSQHMIMNFLGNDASQDIWNSINDFRLRDFWDWVAELSDKDDV